MGEIRDLCLIIADNVPVFISIPISYGDYQINKCIIIYTQLISMGRIDSHIFY